MVEIYECEIFDEVLNKGIYKVIHDSSLNEKHDCNVVITNSINVNCATNMQNPKLGDANFDMSMSVENDTYGITGIPSTVGGCEVVERAGLGVSTKIVYPGSGREDA